MRQRDESINHRNSVRPALDEDFIIADKYPEKEPEIEPIDATEIISKNQERISLRGFPRAFVTRRKIRKIQGRIREKISRDIVAASQIPEVAIISPVPEEEIIPQSPGKGALAIERPPKEMKTFVQPFFPDKKIKFRSTGDWAKTLKTPTGPSAHVVAKITKAGPAFPVTKIVKAGPEMGLLDRFFAWINKMIERIK